MPIKVLYWDDPVTGQRQSMELTDEAIAQSGYVPSIVTAGRMTRKGKLCTCYMGRAVLAKGYNMHLR